MKTFNSLNIQLSGVVNEMTAYPPRLIDRFLERWRLNPAPHPAAKPVALPPKAEPAVGMKALGIKTVGLESDPAIYGALPHPSRERVQQVQQEAKTEKLNHDKEVAPIKSYEYAGSPPGGIGLLDQAFLKRTEAWEAEQTMKDRIKVGPSISEILPNARGTAPIKTMQN